jgi:hypothetical protein
MTETENGLWIPAYAGMTIPVYRVRYVVLKIKIEDRVDHSNFTNC